MMNRPIHAQVIVFVWAILVAGAAHGQLANTPWPKWQRDLRNSGYTPAVGPDEPRLKWKLECFDARFQGVVIGPEGELYTGLHFQGYPPMALTGDFIGYLVRISSSGRIEWRRLIHDVYSSIPTLAEPDRFYAVDGDSGFHWSRTNLYAYTRRGIRVWESRDDPPFDEEYVFNYMTVGRDGTIFYLDGPYVLALNPDGSVKWRQSMSWFTGQCPSIGEDGTVYVGLGFRSYRDVELRALDPQDGSIRWSVSGPREGVSAGTSLARDGTIYTSFFTVDEAWLLAVSPNGAVQWQVPLAGRPSDPPSIDASGRLYLKTAKSDDGGHFLESYEADGTLRWRNNGPEGSTVPIVIDGRNQLYFVTSEGSEMKRLWSYTDAGELRWSFALGNPPTMWQAPVMGPDGTIYLAADETGSGDGTMHVYAIGPGEAPDPAFARLSQP